MDIEVIQKLIEERKDLIDFVNVSKEGDCQLQILKIGTSYKSAMDSRTFESQWPLIMGLLNDRILEIKQVLEK